jgi:hypothetical protein
MQIKIDMFERNLREVFDTYEEFNNLNNWCIPAILNDDGNVTFIKYNNYIIPKASSSYDGKSFTYDVNTNIDLVELRLSNHIMAYNLPLDVIDKLNHDPRLIKDFLIKIVNSWEDVFGSRRKHRCGLNFCSIYVNNNKNLPVVLKNALAGEYNYVVRLHGCFLSENELEFNRAMISR